MSSLFSRLQSYRSRPERDSKEDFFTEALCYVLEKNPIVLESYARFIWGDYFPNGSIETKSLEIKTQVKLGKRRPDVLITFQIEGRETPYKIYCEHKVDSSEGYHQLKNYHNQLDKNSDRLIYITKYTSGELSAKPDNAFRWNQVYTQLELYREHDHVDDSYTIIYNELLTYMKDSGMSETKKFSASEMASFTSLPNLMRLIDECLDGDAWDSFTALSQVSGSRDNPEKQLYDFYRWSYYRHLHKKIANEEFTINIGLLLEFENCKDEYGFDVLDEDYPELLIWIECRPKCTIRPNIDAFVNSFVDSSKNLNTNTDEWRLLPDKNMWVMASVHCSIKEFLKYEDDQIEEIQKWYSEHLIILKDFIDNNPFEQFLEKDQTESANEIT